MATYIFFQLSNEPELGAGINLGLALTPFPSSFGRDLNPQPSNRESSMLTTRTDFCPYNEYLKDVTMSDYNKNCYCYDSPKLNYFIVNVS